MDTITHGIVGALTGKALFAGKDIPANISNSDPARARSSPAARVSILACTIGSIFPDIDIFAGSLAHNPLAIMEWHRNITHSLVLLPLWAVLLAAASGPLARWLNWPYPSFSALVGIYGVGIATHIFLDLATSFGTMVWSPLRYTRPAWDWLFILDLTLTGVALLPQVAAWCYRVPKKMAARTVCSWVGFSFAALGGYALAAAAGYAFPVWVVGAACGIFAAVLFAPRIEAVGFSWKRGSWCRDGLILVSIYLCFASTMHSKAITAVDDFARENHLAAGNRAALPLPPTITHWAGLVSTPEGVWRTTFHEPSGTIERKQFYDSVQNDVHVEAAKKLHDVQVYLWFARFPIWQVLQRDGQTVVDISDVRFFREDDPETIDSGQEVKSFAGIRRSPAGFTFEVVFDGAGQVASHGFKKPSP